MNESIIDFFLLVCQKLDQLTISYMLTGSAAMNYYAVSRTTQDLDIVLEIQENQVESFLEAFPEHYYHQPSIITEIKRRGMFNLIDFKTGYKIDFILRQNSQYATVAFGRRQQNDGFGFPVYVITIEDLILAKLQWIQTLFSERQLSDIQMLLQEENIDINYIRYWLNELTINTYQLKI